MALTDEQKRRIEKEERERTRSQPVMPSGQKYGVPAVLSFFIPGLGQIVKGQVGRGILIFLGTVLGFACFVIPGFIVWIWQIADAYNK